MTGERALAGLATSIPDTSPSGRLVPGLNTLDRIQKILSDTLSPSQIYPTTYFVLADACLFNGVYCTTWTRVLISSASHALGVYWKNATASANDGDEYTLSMPLAAGDYYLEIYYSTDTSGGIVDVYFDDMAISTGTDMYSGSNVYNLMYLQAFTCTTDGNHTVMLKINGKHASSSDYNVYLTFVQIRQA